MESNQNLLGQNVIANADLVFFKANFSDNTCNLVSVISIDLAGQIPIFIKNLFVERMAYIPNHAVFYLLVGE